MKKGIILLIFLLFFSCGGEQEPIIYDIVGVWEVTPTINCQEYDCFGEDCSGADPPAPPAKYSMVIKKSGDDIEAIFHYSGTVDGPYRLKKEGDNIYTLHEFQDNGYFVEIHEIMIILNDNDSFGGKESWRYISGDGYCNEASNLLGEKVLN